jgi:hypothetical protein
MNSMTTTTPQTSLDSAGLQRIDKVYLGGIDPCKVCWSTASAVRLQGDGDDIVLGDVVALVITTLFTLPPPTLPAGSPPPDTPAPVVTIELTDAGDLTSPSHNPLDEQTVAAWFDEHFSFTFTLKNAASKEGRSLPPNLFRPTSVPWIRLLDTSGLQVDFIEVDVDIAPKKSDTGTTIPIHRNGDSRQEIANLLGRLANELSATRKDVSSTAANVTTGFGMVQAMVPGVQALAAPTTGALASVDAVASKVDKASSAIGEVQKTVDGVSPETARRVKEHLTALAAEQKQHADELAAKLQYTLVDVRSLVQDLARTLTEDDRKTQVHLERVERTLSDRIVEVQLELQRLGELFKFLEILHQRLEVLDFEALKRAIEAVGTHGGQGQGTPKRGGHHSDSK